MNHEPASPFDDYRAEWLFAIVSLLLSTHADGCDQLTVECTACQANELIRTVTTGSNR